MILEDLCYGQPIQPELADEALHPDILVAVAEPVGTLENVISSNNGHLKTVWTSGIPGSGKTQALKVVAHRIPRLPLDSKYAVSHVDLSIDSTTVLTEGLFPEIVKHSTIGGRVRDACITTLDASGRRGEFANAAIGTVELGVDIVSTLAGLPALAMLVGTAGRWFMPKGIPSYFKRKAILKGLKSRFNPKVLDLAEPWANQVITPSQKNEDKLDEARKKLQQKNELLPAFCTLLEASGYTTLVLILDEVPIAAADAMRAIWNQANDLKTRGVAKINIVFAVASTDDTRQELDDDEQFDRRFFLNQPHVVLKGPHTSGHLKWMRDKIDDLLTRDTESHLVLPPIDHPSAQKVSGTIRTLSNRPALKWQEAWGELIRLKTRLL